MSENSLPDYATFKSVCIATKNLSIQYCDNGNYYLLQGPDSCGILWTVEVPKTLKDGTVNPDAADFEANIKPSANGPIIPFGYSLPAVNPGSIDTREGVFKVFSAADGKLEWTVPYPYIQLQGIRLEIQNTEQGDKLSTVEIGYYDAGGNWVQLEWYGKDIHFCGGAYVIEDKSDAISAPMPEGLTIRFTFVYANLASVVAKPCAVEFKFWRPYGT